MRWVVTLALAAVVILGLSMPAFAVDPPLYDMTTWTGNVWLCASFDHSGNIIDTGAIAFDVSGQFIQFWYGANVLELGTWTKDFDLGASGCTFYANIPTAARHMDFEGTYADYNGGFFGWSQFALVGNGFDVVVDDYVLMLGFPHP